MRSRHGVAGILGAVKNLVEARVDLISARLHHHHDDHPRAPIRVAFRFSLNHHPHSLLNLSKRPQEHQESSRCISRRKRNGQIGLYDKFLLFGLFFCLLVSFYSLFANRARSTSISNGSVYRADLSANGDWHPPLDLAAVLSHEIRS